MMRAIEARGLGVGYDGQAVIEQIDLDLDRGRILALVGSNGSGKTTLLRTVAGLLPPVAGSLRLYPARAGSVRVAYLGQFHPSSLVLPLCAIDVVRMARFADRGLFGRIDRADERIVREAMEAMGVSHLALEPLNALSGGQKQRVFLAQAFARRADLLLLDEPAANLDAPGRETYRALLHGCAAQGCSAVVATHDIDEAADYDLTMLLAHRVVAVGRADEILTPQTVMETFGIVGRYREGRIVVLEREHGCQDDAATAGSAAHHDSASHAHH